MRPVGVLFAEDFDAPAARRDDPSDEPRVIPAKTPLDIEAARQEAFAQGRAEGRLDALAQMEARAAERADASLRLLERIAHGLDDAAQAAGLVAEQAAESVARLVLGMLATMLPALCARHGAVEVGALARRVLPALAHEPRVVVHVHSQAVDALRTELVRLDPELQTRIAVTAGETLLHGDIRILWRDGGAGRDTAELWRQVGEALGEFGLLDPPQDLTATPHEAAQ